jgi:hypothetical protein
VLEVRRVVRAGSEYSQSARSRTGRYVVENIEEHVRIVLNGHDSGVLKHLREGAFHQLAILQNVADAGRTAEVVLEDDKRPVGVTDEIGPGNVDPDAFGRIKPLTLRAKRS